MSATDCSAAPTTHDGLVACQACGVIDEALSEEFCRLREESAALRGELASKAVAVRRLRGDQAKDVKLHPRYPDAIIVLEYWRSVLAPRTKELNGPRLKNVIARLEHGYTVEDLKEVVDGYAAEPMCFKGTTYRDAELLFRDAKHVDEGIARAGRATTRLKLAKTSPAPTLPHWRQVYRENRDLIVKFLKAEFGGSVNEGSFMLWPCPMCQSNPACTLRVSAEARFSWLAECGRCGATDRSLLQLAFEAKQEGRL